MNRVRILFLLVCFGLAGTAVAAVPHRFEKEIKAFEAADKTNAPPQNAILFLGSSTIRKWTTLAQDFPQHKVFNRGFGGSQISDSTYYFDRIVLPYKPKEIVFYAGSNDINAGKTPEEVAADWRKFADRVKGALPNCRIFFVSINASPSRWKEVEKVRRANRLIADSIEKNKKEVFIDVLPAMLNDDGKPRPELYVQDRLHLNAKGYAIWTAVIAPYLDKAD